MISKSGEQLGVLKIADARARAEQESLDLMLISPDAKPPVCKLVNYGQFCYEQKKKERKAKKLNKNHITKELKLSVKISSNDYNVRLNKAKEFLGKGYAVKVSVFFRGREVTRKSFGVEVLEKFILDIEEYGQVAGKIIDSNRMIYIMIIPKS